MELDYASGRTIVSADCKCNLADDRHLLSCRRQHYLLLGKIAFVNCLCKEHANLIPHQDPHFNSRRPYYRILDPGDWVGCCTANDGKFVPASDQLGINYGSTYKLSCYKCLGLAPPPKRWRGESGDALLPQIAPLFVRRRASAAAAMVAIASSLEKGCAETAHLISPVGSEPDQDAPVTTDPTAPEPSVVDDVSFASLPSAWSDPEPDPQVSLPPSPTPASPPKRKRKVCKVVSPSFSGSPLSSLSYEHFGVGAINGASCLSRGQLETFLPRLLRLMLATNLSALAIADTGTQPGQLPLTSDGVALRTHTAPNGESYSFHSVWSLMGLNSVGKQQRRGSGVSIIWDSRIPFKDTWVDMQGRACAVTLMGPGRRQVRLLAVYGYASPGSWGDRPSTLLSEIQAQRCRAAKLNLSLIVLGEFNSSPLGDAALGFPRPPSYISHEKVCITRACLKEVRAGLHTSPSRTAAPKLKDAFRACHPLVNGATRHFKGQKPARHTLILVPRRFRVIGSNVDSACSWWPDSDHFLLSAWFSFSEVLGVPSLQARSAGRTGFVPSLSTKFLKTPKLRRRWATSLASSSAWKLAAEAVTDVPTGSLAQVEKALHLVEKAIVAASAPFQPLPPPGDTPRPHPSLIAPAWTVLETEASALRAAIHKSFDPVSAAAPALEAWQSLCSLGRTVEFDVSSLVHNIWDTSSWDDWRARVSAACGAIQREGVRRRRRASSACVKFFIEKRSLDGLAGEDGTPGGLRALIRKIGKPDCPPITPKQVRTADGGGSTHPDVVNKAARLCHFEWTLSRRQLPPVDGWPPWARAMYRMGGDSELHDFVSEAQQLLSVEEPEGLDVEAPKVEDEDSSLHSFSDAPTECSSSFNSSTSGSDENVSVNSTCPPTPAPSRGARPPAPPLEVPAEACFTTPAFPKLDITADFSFEDFVYALKRARNGAPGPSGISFALLRALPHVVQKAFWSILLRCLQLRELPRSFLLGHIYTLSKPGEPSLHNVRPITLMECSLKVLTGILNKRLMAGLLANGVFCALQFGFIPGRSGTDPIYILKYAMEDAKERNINIYLMLVDLEKAFDSVESWSLFLSYKWAGLSDASAAMLSALDGKGMARIITPFGLTTPHHVERGVRQGEKLSPTKFILWLEPWLRHAHALYGYHGHTLRGGAQLSHQAMCDDLAFLTTTRLGMQCIATSFWRFAFFHGVTGSAKKTIYASTDPAAGVVSMFSFSRLSTPGNPKRHAAVLSPVVSGKAIRYLGDQLCMLFRWKDAAGAMASVLQMDVGKLAKRRVVLADALQYYSAVTMGKGGYFLPLCRLTATRIQKWDSQLRRILTAKATMAPSTSSAPIFSSRPGGLGVTPLSVLAVAAGVTELYKRLISPGLLGESARSRWRSFQRVLAHPGDIALLSAKQLALHHTGHILRLAWRFGVNVSSLSAFKLEHKRLVTDIALEDVMSCPELSVYLDRMRRSPFRSLKEVKMYTGLTPSPPPPGKGYPDEATPPSDPAFCSGRCRYMRRRCRRCCAIRPTCKKRRGRKAQVQFAWCWAVRDKYLLPGSAVTVPRPALALACPFLTSISRSFPQTAPVVGGSAMQETQTDATGAITPLTLYSDGSLHVTGEGAFSVICLQLLDPWVLEWDDRLLSLEDGSKCRARCTSIGYSKVGHEPLDIGMLELLAALHSAERGPPTPITQYIDASSVVDTLELVTRGISSLRWARLKNAAVWRRLVKAIFDRQERGIPISFVKCAAHGRAFSQSSTTTKGNSCADSDAKATALGGNLSLSPFVIGSSPLDEDFPVVPWERWVRSCQDAFIVSIAGCAVRGDPRKSLRDVARARFFDHWCALRVGGVLARAIADKEISIPSLRAMRSRRNLSSIGAAEAHNLAFCLRSFSLRLPSRMYRSDKGNWPLLPRSPSGRPLCPLCGGSSPDQWHYALECRQMEEPRQTVRVVMRSLIASTESAVTQPLSLVSLLCGWLRRACKVVGPLPRRPWGSYPAPAGAFLLDCLPHGGFGPDRDIEAPSMAKPLIALIGRTRALPTFVLLPGSLAPATCAELRTLKVRFSIHMVTPPGRWPGLVLPRVVGEPTWFLSESVWLLSWGRAPNIEAPPPEVLSDLSSLLSSRLRYGSLELAFHWGKLSWPLDAVDHPNLLPELATWNMLPPTPCSRISSVKAAGPRRTWMGVLPFDRPQPLALLSKCSPGQAKALWAKVESVLSSGIAYLFKAAMSLIAQDLSYRKTYAIARYKGRALPAKKPPFKTWEGCKSFFPPSQSLLNQALGYFQSGAKLSATRGSVAAYAASSSIPRSRWSSLYLAVLYTAYRVGDEAVSSLQPVDLPSPPLARPLFLPSPCQSCRKASVAALVRCPSCMQPRYCSTKCRRKDTEHTRICGWKDPSQESLSLPDDVLLCTRPCNGNWALLPGSRVRVIRPLRHPRLHPTLDLVYIELGDSLLTHTTFPGGGFTPLPLPWVHLVEGPPSGERQLPQVPICPVAGVSAPPPRDDQHGTELSPCDRQEVPTSATDVVDVDSCADRYETELSMWDLSLSQGVRWWDWCLPPSPQTIALATSISGGATAPISTSTLLGTEWVGDSVVEATIHLLSPFCRPGAQLLAPSSLANLLHGGERAARWLPLLAVPSTLLLPVVRLGHWFLVRVEVSLGVCFFHNSLTGHAEIGLREEMVAALSALTARVWRTAVGHSDQQPDGHSCALLTLRNIFTHGLCPPPREALAPLGWPTSFRTHWLAMLCQAGVRYVDPPD